MRLKVLCPLPNIKQKGLSIMPALQQVHALCTLEEYEAFPENERAEVFDGIIYDMASPSQLHQIILTELLVTIRNYIKGKKR